MYDKSESIQKQYGDRGGPRTLFRIVCDHCNEKQGYGLPYKKVNYCKKCQYAKLSEDLYESVKGSCEVCGSEIARPKSQWSRAKNHTCSKECQGVLRRKNITEVTRSRLKAKLIQAGVEPKCVTCGHDHIWNLQAHHKRFMCRGGSNELDNLEFQCKNCHGDIHHEGKDEQECQV